MPPPSGNSQTSYGRIAAALRKRLLKGEFLPDIKMPTEAELGKTYKASRITIRHALKILSDEQLIYRLHGSGSYPSPQPQRRIPLLDTDFTGSLSNHAPEMTRKLDDWSWTTADRVTAAILALASGDPILFARRYDMLQKECVAYDEIYLPKAYAARLTPADLRLMNFLSHWQVQEQLTITHVHQEIEAVSATASIAKHLGIKPGTPVLQEAEIFYRADNVPMGYFRSYFRNDMFRLTGVVRFDGAAQVRQQVPQLQTSTVLTKKRKK